jgi:hypothetical protein
VPLLVTAREFWWVNQKLLELGWGMSSNEHQPFTLKIDLPLKYLNRTVGNNGPQGQLGV